MALPRIEINNFCLTRISNLAEESTCHPFVKGFLMIGQYVSAKLVASINQQVSGTKEVRELCGTASHT